MKTKITYSIDRKPGRWVLHKLIETDKGYNLVGIMTGSKKECEDRKKEILNERNRKRRICKKITRTKNI